MGQNQLESNGYANVNEARGQYLDGANAYDQEEGRSGSNSQRERSYYPEGGSSYNSQRGAGRHEYPNGVNSCDSTGRSHANGYGQQAGVLKFQQRAAASMSYP